MRAIAFICAYNEADIIGWTVRHLREQGIDVHVIDCGSTDGTTDLACRAGAEVEGYIVRDGRVSWRALLTRVEDLAWQLREYEWCIHCDADEIRRSPRPGDSLLGFLELVGRGGYNAVDHHVLTFHPTDNSFDGSQNPEEYFRFYSADKFNERIGQVKAWKNCARVRLAWSGGHRIQFYTETQPPGMPSYLPPSLRVCPMRIISKHYPIRSQAHGERKVFQERRGRWSDPETDWHVQYAGIEPGHNFLRDPRTLQEWK